MPNESRYEQNWISDERIEPLSDKVQFFAGGLPSITIAATAGFAGAGPALSFDEAALIAMAYPFLSTCAVSMYYDAKEFAARKRADQNKQSLCTSVEGNIKRYKRDYVAKVWGFSGAYFALATLAGVIAHG